MLKIRHRIDDKILPKNDKIFLDGIPDVAHNYIKEDNTKDGAIDLDSMLYRRVKDIVSNYTT